MSQRNVEQVIGRLATDEALRRRYREEPGAVLLELTHGGLQLNECELRALLSLDPEMLARFADSLDPRIQKTDLRSDRP